MLCEKCGKNEATALVKQTVNGHSKTYHLCAACAKEQGFAVWNGLELGDFWGSLFAEPTLRSAADTVRCEGCGRSFREITETGHAGCPRCYTTFYDRLLPSLQRIHGKVRHTGKIPEAAGENARAARKLEDLKRQLAESVEKQEYEECARLRDAIRELEGQSHE